LLLVLLLSRDGSDWADMGGRLRFTLLPHERNARAVERGKVGIDVVKR
jgi:hypothetical protein